MNKRKVSFKEVTVATLMVIMLACVSVTARGQIPFAFSELNSDYNTGLDFFNKEKYPAAIRFLDAYADQHDSKTDILVEDARYMSAIASMKLFNPDAEYRMIAYLAEYPASPRLNEVRISMGDYFYQTKNYRKAVSNYEAVNRQELSGDRLAEYFFRLGYSYYVVGESDKALLMFSEIKDIDTEYTPAATYYFSQIAYERKMYETALEGFSKLKDDETFGPVVPFYIVQILYMKKDYDGILKLAPDLAGSAPKDRAPELFRFIGDAYYNKGLYREALLNLEKYYSGAKAVQREDKYQLAYCYYMTGVYDKAIKLLLEVEAGNDLLSQNTWNILGNCYLKTGDKKRAQYAFSQAAETDIDSQITEEALFNYAKLTYELAYNPFGEAIKAFQSYIDKYPGSQRIQEVYDYLVATLIQAKNYSAALSALDRLARKDDKLGEAYQRAAFFRGLELFSNLQFNEAAGMFDKSLGYQNYNRNLMARAIYWKAEALYRMGDYENARDGYQQFMGIPGSSKLEESKLVRYNLGYACFNMKDYPAATTHFSAFESAAAGAKPDIITDARNRLADCYYISTNYKDAVTYYDKVINSNGQGADYAMFRKGFALGLANDTRGKVQVLTSMKNKFPSSPYIPDALYERGRAYLVLDDYKNGEADFNSIISGYPSSQYVPMSMVQLGLLYYNLGENQKAIDQYKKVISGYKSSPEARNAMTGLKNCYVDMNDVESYFAYVRSLDGYGDVNLAEKDSLLYTSAENLYIAARYDRAAEVFANYLSQFPGGSFRQNATFYLAESLRSTGKKDEALKYYQEASSQSGNQFMEQALLNAANINFDNEEYKTAYDYYEKLERVTADDDIKRIAVTGELRSSYEEGDAEKTIVSAQKIIALPNLPEELIRQATFMKAKALYSTSRFTEALSDFRKVAREVKSAEGAESKYRVAELLYKNGQTDESEKTITEFIDQNSPHQFWMARMFLLLADISIKKGDKLQARATLQSLKDYYTVTDDGILDEVKSRLDSLDK